MRYSLIFIGLILIQNVLFAQRPYTIKADTVILTGCDSSELVIKNHTQGVHGFLYNTDSGRTIFKRGAQSIGGGTYIIGADTIRTNPNAWIQGGNSFGTGGILGTMDNNPLQLYSNGTQRLAIFPSGNISIASGLADPGFKLFVNGNSEFAQRILAVQGLSALSTLDFSASDSADNMIFGDQITFCTNHTVSGTFPAANKGIYTFTTMASQPLSGPGANRMVHFSMPVINRPAGEETALRIDFNITQPATSDLRAIQAANGNVIVGTGNLLIGADTGSTSRLDITGANGFSQLRLRTQYTPASSSDTNGNKGDLAADDNYIYYKTSTGWKRAALTTF
jgi:hypothetical protein